jgi:hypothetical protein
MEISTPSTPLSTNNVLPSLLNPSKSITNTTPNTISAPLSDIKSIVASSDYENETTKLLENNSSDNSDSVANSPQSSSPECNTPSTDVVIEKKESIDNTQTKIDLIALPTLQLNKLSRQFIDEANIEVTSVDITSHGCYVLVGCGNGFILLYDLSIPNKQGILVGHIRAKGLHTNLLLSVKITEDCRYCFAGVIRGSSEMVAIDLGRLPVWNNSNMNSCSPRRKSVPILDLITTHSYSDAKLRGFGAAVRVQYPDEINHKDTYRLVCGRGIKNVHVWQFIPSPYIRSGVEKSEPTWTCIYDVASNGNTIELMEFRKGGMELMSKSAGVNLRVWDLSQYSDVDPTAKPLFEDIPNSQDMRSMLDGFAFGGTYDFAVVRLDAPKAANRSAFVVPERNIEDNNGQRRKRLMRQIDEVIGTSDGSHVLALCTDGGVLYFKNVSDDKKGDEFIQNASLIEFNSLRRDEEVDMIWNTKRVGRNGDVVLVRASKIGTIDAPITSIEVNLLTDAASPGEVMSTSLISENNSSQSKWNPCGYYYDYDPANSILDPIQGDMEEFKVLPKTDRSGKPPLAPSVKKVKKSTSLPNSNNKENSGRSNSSTPSRSNSTIKSKTQNNQTPNENSKSQLRTPSNSSSSQMNNNSPRGSNNNSTVPNQKRPRVISPRSNYQIVTEENTINNDEFEDLADLPPVKRNPLMIGNYKKNYEIIESNEKIPLPVLPNVLSAFYQQFTTLKNSWLRISQQLPFSNSNNLNSFDDLLSVNCYSFGVAAVQQLGVVCAEQNRLRQQFITDISTKCNNILSIIDLSTSYEETKKILSLPLTTGIQGIVTMYQSIMVSLVLRQQMDLRGACAMDNIFNGKGSDSTIPTIRFKYGNIFAIAERFDANIYHLLIHTNKLLIEYDISNNDEINTFV